MSRHFQAPNFSETVFFTSPGRKMSVRAGDVIKQVKNSPRYFGKYKTIETIDCHSCFTHFHMLTSKIEGDLTSVAPVLSASNFIPHDPCTCLCPMASRDILRSFEAFLPWIILIPFTGALSCPPWVIMNYFRHAWVIAGVFLNKFLRFWDLIVDRHVKITENAVKIFRNWPKVVVFFSIVVGIGCR